MQISREVLLEELATREGLPQPPIQQDISKDILREELARREAAQRPIGLGERIGQAAHGLAAGPGAVADLVSQYITAPIQKYAVGPAMEAIGISPETTAATLERFENPQTRKTLTENVNALGGGNFQPEKNDTLGNIIHTGAEIISPSDPLSKIAKVGNLAIKGGNLAVKGAKYVAGEAGKYLAKNALPSVGAATMLEATPRLTEEGTALGSVEDIAKSIIGSKVGAGTGKMAADITKLASQGRFKEAALRGVKPITVAASIPKKIGLSLLTVGANPDKKALELAKKHGIELPQHVGMKSPVQSFLNNVPFRSVFTSNAYRKVMDDASDSMIGKVRDALDSVSTTSVNPSAGSSEYKLFLQNSEKTTSEYVKKLYEKAASALTSNDKVSLTNTAKFFNSEEISGLLKSNVKSSEVNKAKEVVKSLMEGWGMKADPAVIDEFRSSPKLLEAYLAKLGTEPVKDLIRERTLIMDAIRKDPELRGSNVLGKLVNSLNEDISSFSNKEFVDKWKLASNYYKNRYADIYKTDLARAIMNGEAPVEVINKMNSVNQIDLVDKITGKTLKGRELFNSIKRAKLTKILEDATEGGIESGNLRTAAFAKLFNKGSGKQEVIERLVGKKQFQNLSEIGKISQAFSDSGKILLNTSGTTPAAADISKVTKVVDGAVGLLFLNSAAAGTLGAAAAGIAAVNLGSRLMANPSIVSQARAYALARQAGREGQAQAILGRIYKMAEKESQGIKFGLMHSAESATKKSDE